MDELKLIFASNLIRLRTEAGYTQAELAAKINYSDKSISKWERGEAVPDAYVLKMLSNSPTFTRCAFYLNSNMITLNIRNLGHCERTASDEDEIVGGGAFLGCGNCFGHRRVALAVQTKGGGFLGQKFGSERARHLGVCKIIGGIGWQLAEHFGVVLVANHSNYNMQMVVFLQFQLFNNLTDAIVVVAGIAVGLRTVGKFLPAAFQTCGCYG